jgi:tRNA(Ile)-lysidine synthetase-like protein
LLRPRQEGDIVKLPVGTQSVKKFMNANKIPPWLRDSWPLLEVEGEIISVVGYWSSETWSVEGGLALNWCC